MIDLSICDIFIRHGYDFWNPNLAAEFIYMLLPLLLGIALYPGIPHNIKMFDEVLLFDDAGEYKESLTNRKVTIVESPEEDK
jgi:hypothetical protein